MKLLLEFEDVRFRTTSDDDHGQRRWLMVTAGGKNFFVQRKIDWNREYMASYMKTLDENLINEMQVMMEGIFLKGLNDTPEGAVETRCPRGEIWRHHFEGRCPCGILKQIRIKE